MHTDASEMEQDWFGDDLDAAWETADCVSYTHLTLATVLRGSAAVAGQCYK